QWPLLTKNRSKTFTKPLLRNEPANKRANRTHQHLLYQSWSMSFWNEPPIQKADRTYLYSFFAISFSILKSCEQFLCDRISVIVGQDMYLIDSKRLEQFFVKRCLVKNRVRIIQ